MYKSENIDWLSMYANCIQLPANVVSINGLVKNIPHISPVTLTSFNDIVDIDDSFG